MQEENFSIPKMNACHYASTPDGQLCFILALKVCEGVQDIAHNIYTSRLLPQDQLKRAPWGSWGGEGRYHLHVSAHTVCVPITHWQRERSLTGHRCLADDTHKYFAPAWHQWKGLRWGLGLTAQLDQGQGGKYRSHGNGERRVLGGWQRRGSERINITFICLKSVTGVWHTAYEYWEKVCRAVSVFWTLTIYEVDRMRRGF